MKNSFRLCLAVASTIMLGVAAASAQDVYKVTYFDNNGPPAALETVAPHAFVRISNPGVTYGNLCAMIYVFGADQQLSECCGCIQSHDGLRTLSIFTDLTKNPLIPFNVLRMGVIKVVSATVNGSPCDPTGNVFPKANLRVWGTHIQHETFMFVFTGNTQTSTIFYHPETETEASDSPLGATELENLQAQCAFNAVLGQGRGICTCGIGD